MANFVSVESEKAFKPIPDFQSIPHGIIIKHKKHYLTRFPLGLLLIVVIAFSPVILGGIGGWFFEMSTGLPCSEANECGWILMTWFVMITFPVAALVLIVYLILIVIDTVKLFKSN